MCLRWPDCQNIDDELRFRKTSTSFMMLSASLVDYDSMYGSKTLPFQISCILRLQFLHFRNDKEITLNNPFSISMSIFAVAIIGCYGRNLFPRMQRCHSVYLCGKLNGNIRTRKQLIAIYRCGEECNACNGNTQNSYIFGWISQFMTIYQTLIRSTALHWRTVFVFFF